jgi:hypothetical protein
MEKTPFIVHCGECNHEWAALYSPMLLDKVVTITMSLHCPECAAGPMQIFCGPAPVKEQPDE